MLGGALPSALCGWPLRWLLQRHGPGEDFHTCRSPGRKSWDLLASSLAILPHPEMKERVRADASQSPISFQIHVLIQNHECVGTSACVRERGDQNTPVYTRTHVHVQMHTGAHMCTRALAHTCTHRHTRTPYTERSNTPKPENSPHSFL